MSNRLDTILRVQWKSGLIPTDNDDGTEKDEEEDLLVFFVYTFIRHNARAAVGIIGTPGAIAMLKGIANYRCASSRREACPWRRIYVSSLLHSLFYFPSSTVLHSPRHDDDRAYPLIRPVQPRCMLWKRQNENISTWYRLYQNYPNMNITPYVLYLSFPRNKRFNLQLTKIVKIVIFQIKDILLLSLLIIIYIFYCL